MLSFNDIEKQIQEEPYLLVLISGNGCANCTSLLPIVKEVANNHNLPYASYDIQANDQEVLDTYNIEGFPTLLLFKDANVIAKVKGYQPLEILDIYIESKLES